MAIKVDNTNYNGEVLERILTVAATSNELVEKGLIMVIPGVNKKISIPRLKVGKMLQKRKENPQVSDSKGDFNWSEQVLEPHDFMAFTVFNPRSFEHIWRKWQPTGNLVFRELPPRRSERAARRAIQAGAVRARRPLCQRRVCRRH